MAAVAHRAVRELRAGVRESDSRLPGAGHSGLADRVFDQEARVARFGLRAQASRDRIQEPAHERQVRVVGVQLFFDAIDGFDQVLLIAAREGHARYGKLNGNQRLMYCGLLRPIHDGEFEPVWQKPQALRRPPTRGWRRGAAAAQKNKSPAWGGAFANANQMGCYLAGAVDASVVDFLLFDDLLCFL